MAFNTTFAATRHLHPLHAILLAFLFPLFLGTLVSDIAYWNTFQIQWSNFAQWLNAGGLLVGAFVVVWAAIDALRHRRGTRGRVVLYLAVLLAAWICGLFNALAHAKDAWAVMPEALWWSGISAGLALLASWLGYSGFPVVEKR